MLGHLIRMNGSMVSFAAEEAGVTLLMMMRAGVRFTVSPFKQSGWFWLCGVEEGLCLFCALLIQLDPIYPRSQAKVANTATIVMALDQKKEGIEWMDVYWCHTLTGKQNTFAVCAF